MDIPHGYCHCGCGEKTRVPKYNDAKNGVVAGEPLKFLPWHHHHLKAKGKPQYIVDDHRGCWVWQRSKRGNFGYGGIRVNNRLHYAHRWFYEQRYGPVPEGLQLDHLCRNPACCNPDHLEPVTHSENLRRGAQPKLNMAKARFIRASESSKAELAQLFGVSVGCIAHVRSGHTWKEPA